MALGKIRVFPGKDRLIILAGVQPMRGRERGVAGIQGKEERPRCTVSLSCTQVHQGRRCARYHCAVRSSLWRDCVPAVDGIWRSSVSVACCVFVKGTGCLERMELSKRFRKRLIMGCHWIVFASHLLLLPLTGEKNTPASQSDVDC